MRREALYTGLILGTLGLAGVFSLLTSEVPVDQLPPEAIAMYTPEQLRWLMLVNPLFLMVIAVVAGSLLYRRSGLTVPLIASLIGGRMDAAVLKAQVLWSVLLGIPTGLFLYFFSEGATRLLPEEFSELSADFTPSIAMKLLYGGITEEIQIRFGLMTFLAWLMIVLIKRKGRTVFWTAIILSSVLFGAGHLGVLFQSLSSPSVGMVLYVVLGNSVAGICFGWLYWKKGLESSMLAHIFAHLTIILLLAL